MAALGALLLVVGAACGDDGDGGNGDEEAAEESGGDPGEVTTDDLPEGVVPACDITETDALADLFGGTEATQELQVDACMYEVTDGVVDTIALLHPSPASDDWLTWRSMIEQWGEGEGGAGQELVDVEGVGDEAYAVRYEDMGEMMLVVRTGTTMFRAGTSGGIAPEAIDALGEFGRHVVDYLETNEAPAGAEAEANETDGG